MTANDICHLSKGCSRPYNHYGPCNDVLTYQCLCADPVIEPLPAWETYQCGLCKRWINPENPRLQALKRLQRPPVDL